MSLVTSARARRRLTGVAAVAAVAALALTTPASTAAAGNTADGQQVLRVGWATGPDSINPYVGGFGQSYTVWSINYDLLINFGEKDLAASPGIATEWVLSEDQKQITYLLDPERKWSDGTPITAHDVVWTLENVGKEGVYYSGYTNTIEKVEATDDHTVVITTDKPDPRMLGDMFIHILPKHIWEKYPVKQATEDDFDVPLPMVGSGPYVVTEYDAERIIRLERNPHHQGEGPHFDELQFVKYGSQDAVERALRTGEVDLISDVTPSAFDRLGEEKNIDTVAGGSPYFTELGFNSCPADICPNAKFNPAVQDVAVRQAIAYAVDRERLVAIATNGTAKVANGQLPQFYAQYYSEPDETYQVDLDRANQLLDGAGYVLGSDGVRAKGDVRLKFGLQVLSDNPQQIQMGRLIAEMTKEIGIEFDVQVVSEDALLDAMFVTDDDEKWAPEFDAFIWNWSGSPNDPSFLLRIMTTGEIGEAQDAFYSNPEYDALYEQQVTEFDDARRKELIAQMVNILQRDLPYLVLTEDPNLQAYRTDRLVGVEQVCPAGSGDIFCEENGNAPWDRLRPFTPEDAKAAGVAAEAAESDGGSNTGLMVGGGAAALAAVAAGAVVLNRRRREPEELEIPA